MGWIVCSYVGEASLTSPGFWVSGPKEQTWGSEDDPKQQ